jgi:hypothetical protein
VGVAILLVSFFGKEKETNYFHAQDFGHKVPNHPYQGERVVLALNNEQHATRCKIVQTLFFK